MYKIITPSGYVVCDDIDSLQEAIKCRRELIDLDKNDKSYEVGFYKIVKQ